MNSLNLNAYAKVNIGLRITRKREDGYHNIRTLYQTVSLSDTIKMRLKEESGIDLEISGESVPGGEDNICYKTAQTMLDKFHSSAGIHIELKKNIPVGAGLGGGSSDSASIIKGIDRLLELKLSNNDLMEIATEMGADVPFFIRGGCQYAEGIGEKLSAGKMREDVKVLLIVPETRIDTSWAYNNVTPLSLTSESTEVNLARFPLNGNADLTREYRNDFETLIFSHYPEIGEIKNELIGAGAIYASLSGSGSAVYGLYESEKDTKETEEMLGERYKFWVLKLVPEEEN